MHILQIVYCKKLSQIKASTTGRENKTNKTKNKTHPTYYHLKRTTKQKPYNARSAIFHCTVRHNQKIHMKQDIYLATKYNSLHLPIILPVIWKQRDRFPKALNALAIRSLILHKTYATKPVNATDKHNI